MVLGHFRAGGDTTATLLLPLLLPQPQHHHAAHGRSCGERIAQYAEVLVRPQIACMDRTGIAQVLERNRHRLGLFLSKSSSGSELRPLLTVSDRRRSPFGPVVIEDGSREHNRTTSSASGVSRRFSISIVLYLGNMSVDWQVKLQDRIDDAGRRAVGSR